MTKFFGAFHDFDTLTSPVQAIHQRGLRRVTTLPRLVCHAGTADRDACRDARSLTSANVPMLMFLAVLDSFM